MLPPLISCGVNQSSREPNVAPFTSGIAEFSRSQNSLQDAEALSPVVDGSGGCW